MSSGNTAAKADGSESSGRNIVVFLDGTNNKIKHLSSTNVVRLYTLCRAHDPTTQVLFYAPGVGTFSSPAAWTPPARTISRWSGSIFGVGMRANLGAAYTFLMNSYRPGDKVFVFGFSRGAYTARALAGMLEWCGLMRPGCENLVPSVVAEYTKVIRLTSWHREKNFASMRDYKTTFGAAFEDPADLDVAATGKHFPVHFLGVYDTVKAAGRRWARYNWPDTRRLRNVRHVRHAVSIDERRRPFNKHLVELSDEDHQLRTVQEVWFAGVHSDVGGKFKGGGTDLRHPLEVDAQQAIACGLEVDEARFANAANVDPALAVARRIVPRFSGGRRRGCSGGGSLTVSPFTAALPIASLKIPSGVRTCARQAATRRSIPTGSSRTHPIRAGPRLIRQTPRAILRRPTTPELRSKGYCHNSRYSVVSTSSAQDRSSLAVMLLPRTAVGLSARITVSCRASSASSSSCLGMSGHCLT
jgi:uncharacterized protein (DUF2235 family)